MSAADVAQAAFLVGAICRIGMAAILAQSAWHGLRDVPAHAAALAGYRLLPASLVPVAAWVLPILTLAAALLLIVPASAAAGAALGAALMLLFTGAIWINLRRGRMHIDCGCGGAQGQHISRSLVVRNIVLLAVLASAFASPATGALDGASLICMAGGAASFSALYFTANQLIANRAAFRAAGEGA
jgi:hypothetical protein